MDSRGAEDARMADRTGRHAASDDPNETLILPAQPWLAHDAADEAAAAQPPAAQPPAAEPSADRPDPRRQPYRDPVRQPTGRHASGPARQDRGSGNGQHGPAEGQQAASSAGAAAAGSGGPSSLRLIWVYPDLLSTYGDRGNLLVLSRRARLRGIAVDAIEVNADQPVPRDGDIYLLGGGEDLPQILAADRLRSDGGLAAAAARGAVIFAVCAGYQLMGHRFGGVAGESVTGLGILDISSGRAERRGVGEIVADVDPSLGVPRLTGFENHQGTTAIGQAARPLATVSRGVGNGNGTEGAYAGKVAGTYLHGPALARNPGLADLLLSWAVGPLKPLDPEAEEWVARLRSERLASTAGRPTAA